MVDHAEQERPGQVRRFRRRADLAPADRFDQEVLGPAPSGCVTGLDEILVAAGPALLVQHVAGDEDGVDPRVDGDVPGVAAEHPDELVALPGADLAPRPDPVPEELPGPAEPGTAGRHALQLGEDPPGPLRRVVDPARPRLELLHEAINPFLVAFGGRRLLRLAASRPLAGRLRQIGRFGLLGLFDVPGQLGGPGHQGPVPFARPGGQVPEELLDPPRLPPRVLPGRLRQLDDLELLPLPEPVEPDPVLPLLRSRSRREPCIPPVRQSLGLGRHRRKPPPRDVWFRRAIDRRRAQSLSRPRRVYPSTIPKSGRPVSPIFREAEKVG